MDRRKSIVYYINF